MGRRVRHYGEFFFFRETLSQPLMFSAYYNREKCEINIPTNHAFTFTKVYLFLQLKHSLMLKSTLPGVSDCPPLWHYSFSLCNINSNKLDCQYQIHFSIAKCTQQPPPPVFFFPHLPVFLGFLLKHKQATNSDFISILRPPWRCNESTPGGCRTRYTSFWLRPEWQ